jgi:BASS family bile acid:Na+ symporter
MASDPPATSDKSPTAEPALRGPLHRFACWVQKYLIWLLLASYALAAVLPQPGAVIRESQLAGPFWGDIWISPPFVLLALLLFCAAISTRLDRVWMVLRQPGLILMGLVGVWLGPLVLVAVIGLLLHPFVPGGVLVGLVLVAAMPVANSSVGWTHNARGNLALSLSLIVFSVLLSPWVTPHLLQLFGFSLTPDEQVYCDLLVRKFSGKFFIVWVILPTLLGFIMRQLIGGLRVDRAGDYLRLTSAMSILILNYANSAIVLPELFKWSQLSVLFTTIVLAVALSLIGLLLADLIVWILREPMEMRTSLIFALSMKHTGLALVLAGTVLADRPRAILMIIVATVVQHVVAGIVQRMLPREDID